jgi:hypothetical protein
VGTLEGFTPIRIDTRCQREWIPPLRNGHLTSLCSLQLDGGPACPACLKPMLPDDLERRLLGRIRFVNQPNSEYSDAPAS